MPQKSDDLPTKRKDWQRAFDAAREAVLGLPAAIRPVRRDGEPGALIELDPGLPCLILPDLHARPAVLDALESWLIPPQTAGSEPRTVRDALEAGRIQVVMLGDGPHSEGLAGKERWRAAWLEYQEGWKTDAAMREEMSLAFTAMAHVSRLVAAYPGRFFFLKGNHDNIRNREGEGDHPYGKFASEGEMAADWTFRILGADFFETYAAFEDTLPLMARGGGFLACHAEPAFPLSVEEVVNARLDGDIVEALTWTDIGQAVEGAVEETFRSFFSESVKPGVMIGGHRPSRERFYLRADGRFIQIHNAALMQAAFILPGQPFDPWSGIVSLGEPAS